jgi:hypothetical protein
MAKTESSAVTNFINSVRGEMSGGGYLPPRPPTSRPTLPGPQGGGLPAPSRAHGTPAPDWMMKARRAAGTQPPPIPKQPPRLAKATTPPPIPSDARGSAFERPAVRAPSQLIVPPDLDNADETAPNETFELSEVGESGAVRGADVDAAIDAVTGHGWAADEPASADASLDIDFDSSPEIAPALPAPVLNLDDVGDLEPRRDLDDDSMQFDRPARRKLGIFLFGGALLAGGAAVAAYIALSGPQVGGDTAASASRAAPAGATDSEPAAIPAATPAPVATPVESAPAPAAPMAVPAATAQAEPATPAPAEAGVVLHRASFTSEPSGATVTLVMNGKPIVLGTSPVDAQLDPSKSYEVVFTMPGRETVLRSIVFDGSGELAIAAALGEAGSGPVATAEPIAAVDPEPEAAPEPEPKPEPKKVTRSERKKKSARRSKRRSSRRATRTARRSSKARSSIPSGRGILMINSKPPCDIIVDGKATGKKTPQRSLALSPGKHTIKLVNRSYKIAKSFRVRIKKGEKTRVIKDMTDRISR